MLLLTLCLVGLLVAPNPAAAQGESDEDALIAFVDVTVVSMREEQVLEGQTVLIRGERILSIGPFATLPVSPGATVIDGSGRFLMPGLADMHVHIHAPFADGPLYLNAGITTVLSMGTDANSWEVVLRERKRSREASFMGPAFYTVGLQAWGGETPDEVERRVQETAELGLDFFKIHGDVSPQTFDRIHEVSSQLGIPVTGHAQYRQGMQPIYASGQDLAHLDEYLYAEFNPRTPGFWGSSLASLLGLAVLSLLNLSWWIAALGRRLRRKPIALSPSLEQVRRWARIFTLTYWLLFIGLYLSISDPFAGAFAGHSSAIALVCVLMVLAASSAVLLALRARIAWKESTSSWSRILLAFLLGSTWMLLACAGFLMPRSWRTTEAALERMARQTAEADIWVTPTLVVDDYVRRFSSNEHATILHHPEMRYIRSDMRDLWSRHDLRRFPDALMPVQHAIWDNYFDLLSRLLLKLHEASVPLLAGSDGVGRNTPGIFPGSSLHEELDLYVQAGLTPYEALRTATVNPATYLNAELEFGQIAEGFYADLVLLDGNPLKDIRNTRTRVGVMKRGRWYEANELEAALDRLAEERE